MRRTALATLAAAALAGIAVRHAMLRRHAHALDVRDGLDADGVIAGGGTLAHEGDGRGAALLLHGFGDTPQSLGYVAGYLHGCGWSVAAPLLPGHGRTLRAFTRSGAVGWIAHARAAYAALRRSHATVVIVGQSMGGALAVLLAAETRPEALVLLAPYLEMPARLRRLADAYPLWSPLLPLVGARGARSIMDDAARAESLAHGVVSGRLLAELRDVVDRAHLALPAVRAPALVVQSRQDHRIHPDACERAVARIGSRRKRLVWAEDGGHVLAVDRGRERIATLVADWLVAETASRPAPVAASHTRGIL